MWVEDAWAAQDALIAASGESCQARLISYRASAEPTCTRRATTYPDHLSHKPLVNQPLPPKYSFC